jgi:hypothetical protein
MPGGVRMAPGRQPEGWLRAHAELKTELERVEPRQAELKAASGAAPDLDNLTDKLLGYVGTFEDVVSQGTVDEKRAFIRAFVSRIDAEPGSCQAHVSLHGLPRAAARSG